MAFHPRSRNFKEELTFYTSGIENCSLSMFSKVSRRCPV
jgi:hypothetical protein